MLMFDGTGFIVTGKYTGVFFRRNVLISGQGYNMIANINKRHYLILLPNIESKPNLKINCLLFSAK